MAHDLAIDQSQRRDVGRATPDGVQASANGLADDAAGTNGTQAALRTRLEKPAMAAVIVGHGERGGAGSNELLIRQAAAVDALGRPHNIRAFAGVLNGSPSFEDALQTAMTATVGPVLITPFFMSSGYFVETVLPRRIAEADAKHRCRVVGPFGDDPGLVPVMHKIATQHADSAGLDTSQARLLLVGHGSRSGAPASARSTRLAASRLARLDEFHCVDIAFLEEAPLVADVLTYCARPSVVMGFFSGDGLHAREDVPDAIETWGRPAVYTGPVGAASEVPELLFATIKDAAKSIAPVAGPTG